jgi:hypothetical protein
MIWSRDDYNLSIAKMFSSSFYGFSKHEGAFASSLDSRFTQLLLSTHGKQKHGISNNAARMDFLSVKLGGIHLLVLVDFS